MINLIKTRISGEKNKIIRSNLEIKNILRNDNVIEEIFEIIDKCIENIYRTIDTEDIEEDFPNLEINTYIENHKKILILIKNMLIKNYKYITETDKKILLWKLENDAKNKFKIEINDIILFFDTILIKIIEYKNIKITYDDIISFCTDSINNITNWTNFLKENTYLN